jgi:TRAP-type mannitol/chloroaromatic compound transport system permease small subunit
MSRGRRSPTFGIVILVVALIAIAYPYLTPLNEDGDETQLAWVMHLWRPVFISIAVWGLIRIMIGFGSATLIRKISDVAGGIAIFVGKLASWIIIPLILMIMFDVITRKIEYIKVANAEITETYGFSVSFILQDMQWHLHGVLLLMTFGFGYMLNSHVRVDIFREGLSRRGQVWIETFGLTILAIPFMLVMIGFSWDLTYASWKINEASESMVGLGWRYIIKSFLIWGFVIALMAAFATLLRCMNYLFADIEEETIAEESLQFFTDNDSMSKLILEENNRGGAEGGR